LSLTRSDLRSWQREAIERAIKSSLLIAAAPGAGKAITKLTAIADGIAGKRFSRVLLVAPRIVIDTVLIPEAKRWEQTAHLTFSTAHDMSGAARNKAFFITPADIVTITPDLLPAFVTSIMESGIVPVDAVFIDEAQAFKNPKSVRTKAMLALSRVVPHIVLASGTPTPNGVINAWTPGRLIAPTNRFWDDNYHRWLNRNFAKAGTYTFRPKVGVEKAIRDELAKSAVSIRLRDSTDIPNELYLDYPFTHDEAHSDIIREFMKERRVEIDGEVFVSEGEGDGGFLTRLNQLTNGFIYLGEETRSTAVMSEARVDALSDVVESVDGPVLVGIRFLADVAMIRARFPKAVVLNGSTPAREREDIIRRWNNDDIPLLLGNPASMGHGVNLQYGSAATMVWYSLPFSWEQYAQMNARLVRSGQKKIISIVRLMSQVGLDHAIAKVLERKGAGEKAIMDALDITKGAKA
jgi:hypothetical protein